MSSLVKCYLPVFIMGTKLCIAPEDFPHFDDFRRECITLLDKALRQSELLYKTEDCEDAHFAVVVWLDEVVLITSPDWVKEWRMRLLQGQRFRTAIGGEEFYSRLDGIDEKNKSVRQVYLFCLLMGFQGKYAKNGKEELQARIKEERNCLPEEWQVWPGNAKIIKTEEGLVLNYSRSFKILKFLHKRTLLFFSVAVLYLLLLSGLHLFIRN